MVEKGGSDDANWAVGGKGGRVQATMSVTPGQVLNIYVGGKGDNYGNGGYNGGGGRAVSPAYRSGGGGGATDIRIGGSALSDRVLVAGGGGGYQNRGVGGAGGGLTGVAGGQDYITSGYVPSGQGGTQTAGGARGGIVVYTTNKATAGTFGIGGKSDHDYSLYCYTCETWGGAGGGGWYGGGGTCNGSGGGGGSSYSDSTIFSNVIHSRGVRSDRGLLVISYRNGVECNTTSTRVSVTVTVSTTPTISAGANFKSCPGHTISLTGTGAGAGVTYTWMPGSLSGTSINVSPTATTTYTVTGTTSVGCDDNATVKITVGSVIANGTQTVCSGTSAKLTASGAETYVWQLFQEVVCSIQVLRIQRKHLTQVIPTGCLATEVLGSR